MCCGSPCSVIRCNGCPATDWSAFTWQWTAPQATESFSVPSIPISRRFGANAAAMTYPGTCSCVWLVDGGDIGTATDATFQPINTSHPIPSIGALEYRREGLQFKWRLTLSRWYGAWSWTIADDRYYGQGWGWWPTWSDDACEGGWGNPFWGGYGGYGYNGWGWAYGADSAWGYLYGETGTLYAVTYSLQAGDVMNCTGGSSRFYLNSQPDNPDFDASHWPAYIDIARVQK